MKNKKRVITLIIIALAITLAVGIAVKSSTEGILFDMSIMEAIHSNNSETGTSIMEIITLLGSKYFFVIVGSIIFIYFVNKMKRRNARLVVSSIVGSYLLNAVLKIMFSRSRPFYNLIGEGGYSFPSGHSMVAMSFYSTMTYLILENIENEKIKTLIWIGNFALIGLIGFSRLYLGVHWPTDVIVAYLMGYTVFVTSKTIIKE